MLIFSRILLIASVALLTALTAQAEVTLAPLFTDHAVLQRDKAVPIWGRADPGEKILISFGDQLARATAAPDGRWIGFLTAMPANAAGADLIIAGKNTVTLRDVVVGEVWLCSGQSNMEWPLSRAANAAEEIAAANFPLIRHLKVARTVADAPAETVQTGGWQVATPQTAGEFTAVGYFFAREIAQRLGVPVGLVNSTWGGTPIEAWMSAAALASDPAFAVIGERWRQALAEYPAGKARYDTDWAKWQTDEATAKATGGDRYAAFVVQRPRPRAPMGAGSASTPAGLFNGMINPLLPYALRGTLWYQGETNTARPGEYHRLFVATIKAWRAHFGQGDFPFYWVQLANYRSPGDATQVSYAFLREAQTQTLELPNTGQAVTIDLGDPADVHPTNKQDVGRRLALLAKNRVYGITMDDTGPTLAGVAREGSALRVRLAHADGGLVAHGRPLQAIEISGADRVFRAATAKIERDTLLVSSPEVKDPVAVRYAWRNAPEANLYNGAGLPAVPFRSDDW
jgi:sialate O-acetylesterase